MKKINYYELAKKRQLYKNRVTREEIENLSIQDYVCKLYDACDPSCYGKQMEFKLIYDSGNVIGNIRASEERGEFTIGGKTYEMKTSYINKNGTYRVANMRKWQEINYFILFLVDDDFKLRNYLVDVKFIYDNCKITAMDNSKKINENNQSYNVCTNFKPEFLSELEKVNILRGNTYNDLLDYIGYMGGKQIVKTNQLSRKANVKNKAIKVSFVVNETQEINGKTNLESVAKLSQLLGHENIVGKFWNSQLSRQQDKIFSVPIGGGYYLNPKFSIRDIRSNIDMLNRKTNLNVRVVERLKKENK